MCELPPSSSEPVEAILNRFAKQFDEMQKEIELMQRVILHLVKEQDEHLRRIEELELNNR